MDEETRKMVLNPTYVVAHPEFMSETEVGFTALNKDFQDFTTSLSII